jgi:hypothetical protein
VSSERITYTSRRDAAPERELTALAATFAYIMKCYREKEGGPASRPEDAKRSSSGIGATANIIK